MKVLFIVVQTNSANNMSPFIHVQGESLRAAGIDISYFFLKGNGSTKYIKGIFLLKKYLQNNKFDLIHAHYNYNGFCASFQTKTPLIVSFLGSDLLAKRSFLAEWLNNKINSRVFKKATACICKTEELSSQIPSSLNKHILPNGINLNTFVIVNQQIAREKLHLKLDKKYILFAADPSRTVKNYPLCLESFNLIEKEMPNVELLTIFNKPQEELNLYYNAADVLLLTSQYEGGVNVVKEAMACNCPIVTTNVGDVTERLSRVSGSFVCNHNANELANAVIKILKHPLRTNGREAIINQQLTVDQIANKIIDIYKKCLLNK